MVLGVRVVVIQSEERVYLNRPDPIVFMTVAGDTTVLIYDDFSRLLFFDTHREGCTLVNELSEVSDPFRFLHTASLSNLKGSVGLILTKTSAMRGFDSTRSSFLSHTTFFFSCRKSVVRV